MATINLKIEVPDTSIYDLYLLKRQLTDFARILVSTSQLDTKTRTEVKEEDPFACFSGDWGGSDKSAHEISEELRTSRHFSRNIDTW